MESALGVKFYPTVKNVVQYCSPHEGRICNLKDPMMMGRAKIELPGMCADGKENWTDFVIMTGNPVGCGLTDGDEGFWWPAQVGQHVMVDFPTGDPGAYRGMYGSPCADNGKGMIPLEPLSYGDGRKATRCRIVKSEAGHTSLYDDNGKSELRAELCWSGSGFAIYAPGKEKDEDETEDEESKPRKGARRGAKNVFDGSAPKPSELIEGGVEFAAWVDLCGQGPLSAADDKNGGYLCAGAGKSPGEPSVGWVADAANNRLILFAGETQIQIMGDLGRIFVTKQMVVKSKLMVVGGYFSGVLGAIGKAFKKYAS